MKKVISLVLNNFKNDSRVLKEAVSLQKNGYEVRVVALHEDSLPENETIDGIAVHRIRLGARSWPKNMFFHLVKYAEFFAKIIHHYRKADIIHCNDLNTLPIGVAIKIFFNTAAKVVYDAHEYETEVSHIHGVRKQAYKWLEKLLISHADGVITVSDSIAREYQRLYAIRKPTLVLNTPAYRPVHHGNLFRQNLGIKDDQVIFLYQGGLTEARGVRPLLEAFKKLADQQKVIVFMGYGPMAEEIREAAAQNDTIFFHPAVSPDILLDYTSSADIGTHFIPNTCLNHYYCLPNKLFEYTMAGLPVVVSNMVEMAHFVREHSIGVVAEQETSDAIIEAIARIGAMDLNAMKTNALNAAKTYNWEAQEKELLALYGSL